MDQVAPQNKNFLTLLAEVDLVVKKLSTKKIKRAIIFLGLSRVGKSTKYSHFFNVPLIGQRRGINIMYSLRMEQNQVTEFRDGIISTTTVPKIIQRTNKETGETQICIDLAGFDDKRTFEEVLCVSYSLKKVFETVQQCKFVFVTPHDSLLTAPSKLYDSIIRFTSIFQYAGLSQEQKKQFLNSITMIITRSQYSSQDYSNQIQQLLKQITRPSYRQIRNPQHKETVIQFLKYFSQYEQSKISLFAKAVANIAAPPCDLYQKNIRHRTDFKLKNHRDQFRNENFKSMIYLPFQNDRTQLLDERQQKLLKDKCGQRVGSFTELINILISFFNKITKYQNIYQRNVCFAEQFKQMRRYNQKYNVYPTKFKQQVYQQQTSLRHVFDQHDIQKQLDFGIRLVQTVFQLFRMLSDTPLYKEEKDVDLSFQEWMSQFRSHMIKILTKFRNSFCKNYKQQQILLQFLFIAVRGCNQLGVIFQITGENKNQISSNLKQVLKKALGQRELSTFENQFIDYLARNQETSLERVDEQQFKIYHKFVMDYKSRSQDDDTIKRFIIANSNEFINLYNIILKKGLQFCVKLQQKIVALDDQLISHKTKSKKDYETALEQQDDEECEQVQQLNPLIQKNNFIFKSIFANIAHSILQLIRNGDPEKDVYSSKRLEELSGKTQNEVKKIFAKQQAEIARHIFVYINDVESTIQTYKKTIDTIDEKDYNQLIEWLEGFASYLLSNGRKDQAIQLYQKILQLALLNNLMEKYNQTKKKIIELPQTYEKYEKQYILKNKHSDMNNIVVDPLLQQIMKEIQDNFVFPYQEYLASESMKRARKLSQNM